MEESLGIREAAMYMGTSTSHVYNLIATGRLEVIEAGAKKRVTLASVHLYLGTKKGNRSKSDRAIIEEIREVTRSERSAEEKLLIIAYIIA